MTDNSNMIEHLKLGQKEFLIVGTAHVSRESTDLVKATIEEEQHTRYVLNCAIPATSPSAIKTDGRI